MRLTSSTTSHRVVDEEVKVGPNDKYTLYPGAKVFAPARPLHLSEDIWGSDVLKFNPDRFLQNPERGRQGNLSMRPFGGGASLCPGRHFAGNEVKQFVVGVLRRFELEVHPDVTVPPVDDVTPNQGTMKPLGDVVVRMARKVDIL